MSAQVQLGSRMLVPPRIGAFLSALPAFWGRLSASPWLRAHMTALPRPAARSFAATPPAPPSRHSVGFPGRGRDPERSSSVHLCGGTRGLTSPPCHPVPLRLPTWCRAHPTRAEDRRSRPMPLPFMPDAHDDVPPLRRSAQPTRARGDGTHAPRTDIRSPAVRPTGSRPGSPGGPVALTPATGGSPGPPPTGTRASTSQAPPAAPRRPAELPPAHTTLICVALPGLAISTDQGQLNGSGLEGFYRAGRRMLSRCQVRVAGREPLAVQARMLSADRARFVATLRMSADTGPDPDVMVERTRYADGTERITLHSTARRPLRLPVEVSLGTDLAALGAVASGSAGPELPASVHDSGLRWSCADGHSTVTAHPPPADALASAGLLRWELELPPGGTRSVELRVRPDGAGPIRPVGRGATSPSPRPGPQATTRRRRPCCTPVWRTLRPCCCATRRTRPTPTSRRARPGAAAWLRPTRWQRPG